ACWRLNVLVADWVTASRHITAITAAMTMIRNIAATRPKPRCFPPSKSGPYPRYFCAACVRGHGPLLRSESCRRSGRIVEVDLLQQGDAFAGLLRHPLHGDQPTAHGIDGLVAESAGTHTIHQ